VLAGQSTGGIVLMAAANREAVCKREAAVLLGSTASSRLLTDSQVVPLSSERLRKWLYRALLGNRASLGPLTPFTKRILKYATMGPASTLEMVQACARVVHAYPSAVRAGWVPVLADLDLNEELAQQAMPAAVIESLADRPTPGPTGQADSRGPAAGCGTHRTPKAWSHGAGGNPGNDRGRYPLTRRRSPDCAWPRTSQPSALEEETS
jgi:hypothetical protein